jgi:hypothetical protein
MPSVPRSQLHSGTPRLLLDHGFGHSVGWQDSRRVGPCFVIARLAFGRVNVKERFPLTEQGWASAWQALADCDPGAAEAIAANLAKRDARSRTATVLTALDAESLCLLRSVAFNGGSGRVVLTKGQPYDVRFLSNGLKVCAPHTVDAILEIPYRDVETVDVSGSGSSRSGSDLFLMILVLSLLGALVGHLFLRLPGFFFGALIFGLIGAIVGSASTKIETIVRIRSRDAELYFLHSAKRPDALRIELSESFRAIDNAHATESGDRDEPADVTTGPSLTN